MEKTKTLTEDELVALKKKACEILSVSRRNILVKYPFIGSIALRMNIIPVRDIRVRTACTDGNSVYFDLDFLSSLNSQEQVFVLAHEVWHAVLMHLIRRHARDPELFNIATDKEVNGMLAKDGLTPPDMVLMPEGEEQGKCAEEIYEMLLKKMKKNMNNLKNSLKNSANSNGNGKKTRSKDDGGGSDPDQQPNKNGKLSGQFDKHVYDGEKEDDGDGDGKGGKGGKNGKITDKWGEVGLDPDFKPMVSKDFADKMRETIISEAQRCEKTRGNVPAHIRELIKKISEPEVKWQEVLAQFVTRAYHGGTSTWIPPNRRYVHRGMYLPSRKSDKIRLCVGIDTSGSTMGDRAKFMGELNSLIKSFGIFDLTLIECDCEIGNVRHFTQDDNLDSIIERGEYDMSGGGGTAMTPIYDYILDHQIETDSIVILTDGYIDDIPKNPIPSIPTLWVITKDGTEDFCDWGQKVKLKKSDSDYE